MRSSPSRTPMRACYWSGWNDDGTATGHGYSDKHADELFAVPHRRLTPAVDCRSERLSRGCHEILAFEVPGAPEAVMIDGNGCPYSFPLDYL